MLDAPRVAPVTEQAVRPQRRLRRWSLWAYEAALATLAVLTLWLLAQPEEEPWVDAANLSIWLVFVGDYTVRLIQARNRKSFVRQNWLDLIAILPLDFLRTARLLRIVRLIRVVRALAVLWRAHRVAGEVIETNGLGYVLLFTGGLIVVAAAGIRAVEPGITSIGDGLWWSMVTITTVGYGDISPSTAAGRVIAALLMVAGISTMGMVTASLTGYFMGHQRSSDPTIEHIKSELDRWDELSDRERQRLAMILQALADEPEGPAYDPKTNR